MDLKDFTLIGEPGRNYSLAINSTGVIDRNKLDVIEAIDRFSGAIEPNITVRFRECQAGEAYLHTGECQTCDSGSYLFDAPNGQTDCNDCPPNARCFGGSEIGPVPGLWRAHERSLSFRPCFNPAACLGSLHPSVGG